MSSQDPWTRVIVLRPPDSAAMSDALKAEFARRDWFAVEQCHPCLAMAELCLRERSQTTRAAWGLQRLERLALVILQPEHWRETDVDLEHLIAAVCRYLPKSSIWEIRGDRLLPVHVADQDGQKPAARATPPPQLDGLAHDGHSIDSDDDAGSVTRQELEMLLEIETRPVTGFPKGAAS